MIDEDEQTVKIDVDNHTPSDVKFMKAIGKAKGLWDVIIGADLPASLGIALNRQKPFEDLTDKEKFMVAKVAVNFSKHDREFDLAFDAKYTQQTQEIPDETESETENPETEESAQEGISQEGETEKD